ncbi:hypothetical protein V9T40_006671 [Parthenolecanium corni]|uniref:Transient receptor potential channel pyrexia n=1 Tax=Parthenolecanium corni TaxID=536013 RepID=A0AAN9TRS7_9HEMI
MKHKRSIKSHLFSLRNKSNKAKSCRAQCVSLKCMDRDQAVYGAQLTVPVLRENVRLALFELMRLMRTHSGRYLNLETDDISSADIDDQFDCNCAFLWAAYSGDTALMQRLHDERGADPAFAHPQVNFNALHLSALCGSLDGVLWLLRKQCPIVYTSTGLSPLHFAAYGKSVRICRYLIEQGCRVDGTVLHAAAYAGSLDCAAFILESTSSPNSYDENGNTALHIAVDLGKYPIVKLLLDDPRTNVNAKTLPLHYTALHLAADNGYTECMQALLRSEACVNVTSTRGHTPLHLCCKQSFIDCVQLLLEHGADVNTQDNERRSALHAAVSKSPWSLHIVRMLVERDANVNLADAFGYTCLHVAALNELDECVEYLIMQGANVAARTQGNVSALNIINRKTPVSVKTIPRRLDLAMSYKEQNLKLNFRDILRNSPVGEIGFLYALQKEGQSQVLEHPLCQAFLHLKWQKVRAYIIIRVIISIITALLLSVYVLLCITNGCDNAIAFQAARRQCSPTDPCAHCYDYTNITAINDTDLRTTCESCANQSSPACGYLLKYGADYEECKKYPLGRKIIEMPNVIDWMRNVIIAVMLVNAVRVFFSLAAYRTFAKYFTKYVNALEVIVSLSVVAMAIDVQQDNKFDLHTPVGACAVLCAWSYLMITIGQLPFFGTYIAMFNKVLKEFLKMITAFFCLLVGFTFTFCVLKPDYFGNPLAGFVRVVGMMTGELNLSDVITLEPSMFVLEYTMLAVLWLFMILVTIVLMNLLVGIAVNDVEGLRKTADLCELIQQTKLIYFIEVSCFKGYFPKRAMDLLRRFLFIWPDSYTVVLSVRPLNPHEKRIPKDIMDAAVEIAVRRTQNRYKMNAKTPTIEKRLDTLEGQLRNLEEMVASIGKNLIRITGDDKNDKEEDTEPMGESEDTN